MSKIMDLLRSVRVFNDYDFFQDEPYIWYRTNGDYRSLIRAAWVVTKRGVRLSNAWYDNGSFVTLSVNRSNKLERFEEVKAYMKEHFGVTELKRSPTGGWGSADYVDRRLKEIKEMAKSVKGSPRED